MPITKYIIQRFIKIMFAVLTVGLLVLMVIPCMAEGGAAWVDFSNNKEMYKFSNVSFASDTTAVDTVNTAVIDGIECWQMEKGERKEYIRFNIDNSFISSVKDGTEYVISVDYYDGDTVNNEKGFFSLEYDAIDKKCKFGGMVILNNSGTWKTAVFKLDDAYFGTRMMNRAADFRLSVVPQKSVVYSASPVPVAIKSVRVAPTGVKRSVRIVSSTDQSGNAFSWDSDNKVIKNTLKNTTNSGITADFTFKALLDGDKTVFSTTKTITIAANSTVTEDIIIPITRCGVYNWVVDVAHENGVVYNKECTKFAVIKTDKDGIKNDSAYVAHHLNRYFVNGGANRELTEGMDLIAKSNAGGIRAESSWGDLKVRADSELTFKGTSAELIDRLALQHNLGVTWLLSGGCYAVTGGWDSYPDTADEINAYKDYVSYTAQNVKNSAVSFELAHEIDTTGFNPVIDPSTGEMAETPSEYADLIKETAAALKDANVDKPLIAYGLVNLEDKNVSKWLDDALDNNILNYLDVFSYHPYTHAYCNEAAWNLWHFAPKIKDKLKNANQNAKMAITELGVTLADNTYVDGKRSRGANMCRGTIAYTVRGLADFVTNYVFEEKGQLGEIAVEDGFGMVDFSTESMLDDSNAIFIPNDTYISFTAMNYVLGQSKPWKVFELGDYISASGFISDKFSNKVVVLNTVGSSKSSEKYGVYNITKEVTLQLGTDEITCFDDFGNETKLVSDSGIYTFMLNERPLYIVGDITDVILQEQAAFGIDAGSIKFDNIATSITLYADDEEDYTAELFLPDCVSSAMNNIKISDGSMSVPLILKWKLPEKSVAEAVIRDSNNNCVFFGQITLEQDDGLELPFVWTEEVDANSNIILVNFSEPIEALTNEMLLLTDIETLTPVNISAVKKISSNQWQLSVDKIKSNAEYKLEISNINDQIECKTIYIYVKGMDFGVKKVRYDSKLSNAQTTLLCKHSDDFSKYDMAYNPGLNKDNSNDYAEKSNGMWSRYHHTQAVSWWGQGTYVNDFGQLSIDAYSNTNPITVGAVRQINEDGSAIKNKIFNVNFDMAYYILERHDGSSFTLYADDYPIFNVSRTEAKFYKNQEINQSVFLTDNSFAKSNYGKDLINVDISFDFLNKKVKIRYGDVVKVTYMNDAFALNGVSSLKFLVNLSNGIEGANGDYRGNAFVMDNYFDEVIDVLKPSVYLNDIDASEPLVPTSANISIEFTDIVDESTLGEITITDNNQNEVSCLPSLSKDEKTLSLDVALEKETSYILTVPTTVKSASGFSNERTYQFVFSTGSIIKFLDENGNEFTEQELTAATSAYVRVLLNAPPENGKYKYIYATYDKKTDVLKNVEIKDILYVNGDIIFYDDKIDIFDNEYAKIFIWENMDSISPINRSYTIGK